MRDFECFGRISTVSKAVHGFLDSLQAHASLVQSEPLRLIFPISHERSMHVSLSC